MTVVVVENVEPKLRGRLSILMIEVRAGVYIGDLSKVAREIAWLNVCEGLGSGSAVISWASNNESGFEFQIIGENRRSSVEYDGICLVSFKPESP